MNMYIISTIFIVIGIIYFIFKKKIKVFLAIIKTKSNYEEINNVIDNNKNLLNDFYEYRKRIENRKKDSILQNTGTLRSIDEQIKENTKRINILKEMLEIDEKKLNSYKYKKKLYLHVRYKSTTIQTIYNLNKLLNRFKQN